MRRVPAGVTSLGIAIAGVAIEFTGVGEAYDGTVGLATAVVTLGWDLYNAFDIK